MAILDGKIVQHLEDPPGSGRAFCNGEKLVEYHEFQQQKMGFIFCEACRLLVIERSR